MNVMGLMDVVILMIDFPPTNVQDRFLSALEPQYLSLPGFLATPRLEVAAKSLIHRRELG
jgi:hypothetical protein